MYNADKVAEAIKRTARERGTVIKIMLTDCALGSNTMSNLYHGSMLKADSLAKIADYLDVSVDYLLGRTDNPKINR